MRDAKKKTRRQMVVDARDAALQGNWDRAVEINQLYIESHPRDAEAHNRLGRAYLQLGRYAASLDAYSSALRIDPANMIARRNLQRMELLRHRATTEDGTAGEPIDQVIPRTSVFIEEVGKTWVAELVNPMPMETLADVPSGEQLQLAIDGQRLFVERANGQRLGEIEAKTAERVIELLANGNRYEVFALGLSAASLRVILREVYRDPSLAKTVSFPRQISATRAYLRERDLLRQRDEADFLLLDDDDDELEEEEAGPDAGDDDETSDADADTFIEDTVTVEEEEPHI